MENLQEASSERTVGEPWSRVDLEYISSVIHCISQLNTVFFHLIFQRLPPSVEGELFF